MEEDKGCFGVVIAALILIFGGGWIVMWSWNDLAPFFLGDVNRMSYWFGTKCALSLFAMRVLLK